MKRSAKNLPDTDLNGRIRRHPKPRTPSQLIDAKLYGGPMDGQIVRIPRGAERYEVGPKGFPLFIYTYAGKDGRQTMLAPKPRARAGLKLLYQLISTIGKDPRIVNEMHRRHPVKNTGRVAHGRGAAKRAAQRLEK